MDDEFTAGYTEPCAQCSAVDWGVSDEGRFYCRSCHNVIERTKEVVDPTFTPGFSRASSISKGARTRRPEVVRQWMVCEGFQFILRNQANALLRLGVRTHFKDEVLCHLWRSYLQMSRQAYTHDPVRTAHFKLHNPNLESDSAAESSAMSASETDGETRLSSTGNSSECSVYSGSVDVSSYLAARLRRTHTLMSMVKTLALIHLALIWSREPLTLSDLLRLVNEGHVPYVNAYEELPEEMKLQGKDTFVFRVESVPSYRQLHQEAQALLQFLQLPAFPPISRQSLLHPAALSVRYLTDANLPDELHLWVCRLMKTAGVMDEDFQTINCWFDSFLPQYDVQSAAFIIVTMKLLFGLDDCSEWELSNEVGDQDETGDMFNLRRWYRLLQAALTRAQHRRDHDMSRKQWKGKKPIFMKKKEKYVVMMKKRRAEQLQGCFEKVSSCPVKVERPNPSSFRFCWGDEDKADGPSLHQKKLDGLVTLKDKVLTPRLSSYWHPALRRCRHSRGCRRHYLQVEPTLPRMFVWLLQLFSFLLDVKPEILFEEVLRVERRVIGGQMPGKPKTTRVKTGTRPRTRGWRSQRLQES